VPTSLHRTPTHRRTLRWPAAAAVVVLAVCLGGCTGATRDGGGGGARAATPSTSPSASPTPEIAVEVSPAPDSTDVAPATPVVVRVRGDRIGAVDVRSADGDVLAGERSADGTAWTSRGKLSFGARYIVTLTPATYGGMREVASFRTAPKPSAAASVRTSSVLGDGVTYGVAMPIVLQLDRPVRDRAARVAYEQALKVRSTPPTSGAWGWISDTEVHFRPKVYWAAGSKVHVTVDTAGRPLGSTLWGRTDLTVAFRIGERRELIADAKTYRMVVMEGGRAVRTMPVSLGKPTFPSSSGTMVVIEKKPAALFDSSTYGLAVDSPDGYRTKVKHAIRLTWGGEFIHGAPWSVRDQGRRNVSHGCINAAPADAAWLFGRVRMGDPVVVRGTGTPVALGNGWTEWTLTYAQWLTHSATGDQLTT